MGADGQTFVIPNSMAIKAKPALGRLLGIEQLDATRRRVPRIRVEVQPLSLPACVDIRQVGIGHIDFAANLNDRRHVVAQKA